MNRVILFDNRPKRLGWLVLLLCVLAVLLVVIGTNRWRDEARTASTSPTPQHDTGVRNVSVAAPVLPVDASPRSTPVVSERAVPAVHCAYQHLDIVPAEGRPVRACVAATRASQSGDMRSYMVEPQGVSEWTLRIDTGDGKVLAASLSAPGHSEYLCENESCTGFVIGPRDAQGGRSLSASGAVLATATGSSTLSLSAALAVQGDQQDPSMACSGDSIAIVERSGAVLALCPSIGAGIARFDDERRVFSLRGTAGDTLEIGVDRTGAVDYVGIGGLECQGYACAGAGTRAGGEPDSESGRVFTFSGTTLTDGRRGGNTATLNGSAVLPPI